MGRTRWMNEARPDLQFHSWPGSCSDSHPAAYPSQPILEGQKIQAGLKTPRKEKIHHPQPYRTYQLFAGDTKDWLSHLDRSAGHHCRCVFSELAKLQDYQVECSQEQQLIATVPPPPANCYFYWTPPSPYKYENKGLGLVWSHWLLIQFWVVVPPRWPLWTSCADVPISQTPLQLQPMSGIPVGQGKQLAILEVFEH